jgi:uncharacterized protein (DUF924 family)
MVSALQIIQFWFGEHADTAITADRQAGLWWGKDATIDLQIKQRFEVTVLAAEHGDLDSWSITPQGILALILLTDQFPRNMYRHTPRAFAFDAIARRFCRLGLQPTVYAALRPIERTFVFMPLMHSELLTDQQQAVALSQALVEQAIAAHKTAFSETLEAAIQHRDIIMRFGRFPHRNQILQRQSTPEELAFLQQPGSSF